MNPKVTVYVMSCDRPRLIVDTLDSILAQTYEHFELVVSDNSEHDDVETLLRGRYPAVRFIRRKPTLLSPDHFVTVLSEIDSECFVLFHDDDVMHAEYLERLVGVLEQNSELAAVACNAWILRDDAETGKRFMDQQEPSLLLDGPEALVSRYLSLMSDIAPFPGYLYRTAKVKGLLPNYNEGGKYADVSFLMKVAERGPIAWLREPLIRYRFHSSNDSGAEAIEQRLSLLRYVYKHTSLTRHSDLVKQFRFAHWSRWLLRPRQWPARAWRSRKARTVTRFVASNAIQLLFAKPRLWKRIIVKQFL